jgi:hypothetical protein
MYRLVDVIGGVDFVCTVWLMLFVGCILCIVNVYWCAERTLRVCYLRGGFLCTVRSMLFVGWIFMYRSVDVIVGCILCIINDHGGCHR